MTDQWTNRLRIAGWSAAALLLLLPWVAKAPWTASDYVFAAILLGTAGLVMELAVRMRRDFAYRAGVGLAVLAGFMLVWINGAVGIIGDEDNPANLMYAGVLAVAVAGAYVARGEPAGMSRAMVASAAAMVLIAAIALAAGQHGGEVRLAAEVLGVTGLFVALFLSAAWLFQRAGQAPSREPGAPG